MSGLFRRPSTGDINAGFDPSTHLLSSEIVVHITIPALGLGTVKRLIGGIDQGFCRVCGRDRRYGNAKADRQVAFER